ncbi:Uncharacterised protein [Mycobacteroides abscessus subsp. abscessus]|nr:Uncharacterised protein [Mycobacteroides abscessus subsp. abscessus]SKU55253.1 Uncharacterised protein [Mycobacteroides abscessus subsp. abscessus]
MIGPRSGDPSAISFQESPPTLRDTGYLVVNHPTVRDRSISSPATLPNSSWRPCPSTPIPIEVVLESRNSFHAKPNAISRMSCTPA